jgi:hypothetical protein
MSKGVGHSRDEQRLHVGRSKSWGGTGRFTNRKDTAEPPPEVEGRSTLNGAPMKSLGFRTGDNISRKLRHGLRPLEFVFGGRKLNQIHGANALQKKDQ